MLGAMTVLHTNNRVIADVKAVFANGAVVRNADGTSDRYTQYRSGQTPMLVVVRNCYGKRGSTIEEHYAVDVDKLFGGLRATLGDVLTVVEK